MLYNLLLDGFINMAMEYWYITIALFTIAVTLVVLLILGIKKILQNAKSNAQLITSDSETELIKTDDTQLESTHTETIQESGIVEEDFYEGEEIVVEGVSKDESPEKPEIKAVYRVIYDKESKEWTVKKDGAQRVIRRVKTKREALELATQFSENQELNLTVQKKDGKYQKKRNYKSMMQREEKGE